MPAESQTQKKNFLKKTSTYGQNPLDFHRNLEPRQSTCNEFILVTLLPSPSGLKIFPQASQKAFLSYPCEAQ